jgi:hypothetical protein
VTGLDPVGGVSMHHDNIVLLDGAGDVTKKRLGLEASIEDFR